MVDSWHLFYNVDDEFEKIANFSGDEIKIFHDAYYKKFLGNVNENN